jgi:hypothetical protein
MELRSVQMGFLCRSFASGWVSFIVTRVYLECELVVDVVVIWFWVSKSSLVFRQISYTFALILEVI